MSLGHISYQLYWCSYNNVRVATALLVAGVTLTL